MFSYSGVTFSACLMSSLGVDNPFSVASFKSGTSVFSLNRAIPLERKEKMRILLLFVEPRWPWKSSTWSHGAYCVSGPIGFSWSFELLVYVIQLWGWKFCEWLASHHSFWKTWHPFHSTLLCDYKYTLAQPVWHALICKGFSMTIFTEMANLYVKRIIG